MMKQNLSLMLVATLLAATAIAQERDVYVPAELEPWRAWVLEGREYRDCPFFFNRPTNTEDQFVCAWPGRLALDVELTGATFTQEWTVYAGTQWVPLPGSSEYWPQDVTVGGRSRPVTARDNRPALRLEPGRYRVAGRFAWAERPRRFPVPPQSGLVDLSIDGTAVARPEREAGSVWFGEESVERAVEDAVRVQAYRLVADDVPLRLTTRLQIDVAGSVREELFGPVLPEGYTPLALNGDLPARMEADGNLRLQVRPGSWTVTLVARAPDVAEGLAMPAPEANMPAVEIWSYQAANELRVTVAEGLPPVDPLQTGVPADWQRLPAYRAEPGATLSIVERSRGRTATDNSLALARQLWLDFDRGGYVMSDRLGGTMRSDWRLDMAAPYTLLSAEGGGENLLVTAGRGDGLSGVEIRASAVELSTLARIETLGRIPVTGWQATFEDVQTTLNVPPGNMLLVATGADPSSTSWVDNWQLLDFFLVLITALAAARIFGRNAGLVALAGLTLSLHEPGAPQFLWLNLLVAVALARVAPDGRLKQSVTVYRNLSLAALLILLVPFATNQLRIAVYPQLESQRGALTAESYQLTSPAEGGAMAPEAIADMASRPAAKVAAMPQALEEVVVSARREPRSFSRYAPNAVVQVGPGRPDWSWNTYRLSWSGPVDAAEETRLVVLPRWLVSFLRFVEVGLLGLFVASFAAEAAGRRLPWPARGTGGATAAAAVLAVTLASSPAPANADTPSDDILRQLEARLLAPPPCLPRCAEIVDADVVIETDSMTIRLRTDALENVALPLPGSLQGWRPERITIDGAATSLVYRGPRQELWIRTAPGRHELTLSGPLPPVDSLEVPFPLPPRMLGVQAGGWFVAGVDGGRLQAGSLQLTRLRDETEDGQSPIRWESSRFPLFVNVERRIELDLDWRVTTTVTRVAPEQGAINVRIPLLPDESVLSEAVTVEDGAALVAMDPTAQFVEWQSTLPAVSPLALSVPAGQPWKETWNIGVGSIWHTDFGGVPESESGGAGFDFRVATFFPRPGESLTIDVDRPAATSGDTMVFDAVSLRTEVGTRARNHSLSLGYRSTRGQQHQIRLPADAEVTGVLIDRAVTPLRAEDGVLQLPILPGEHRIDVHWRDADAAGLRVASPAVDLAAGASNVRLTIDMPDNRWILATFGPRLGPGVLYWSELVVLVLVAGILARVATRTPLGLRQWLLLGLGFSTFSWFALALVVVWLLAVGAAQRLRKGIAWWQFNLVQFGIGLLSVVALITIVVSLPFGLLGSPDMHVAGYGSYDTTLNWFADRSIGALPGATVLSVPLWIYQALILAWALWLSFALLKWLPWVWREFAADGLIRPRGAPPLAAGDSA